MDADNNNAAGSGILLVIGMLASYAVAVYCRLGVVDHGGALSTFDVATADGYGWLAAVEGLGTLSDHVLAQAGRWLLSFDSVDPAALALYAPVLAGSLTAPLMMYWVYAKSGLAGGIFAGILGMQLPVLYSRTSFGYFDSDAVIIPLLVLIIICYESWFAFADKRIEKDDGKPLILFGVTVALGAAMYLAAHVHVVFSLNAIALVLVSIWLRPRVGIYGLYALATALFGLYGAGLSLLAYWVMSGHGGVRRDLRTWASRRPLAGVAVLLAVIGVAAVLAELAGTVDFLSRLEFYVYDPLRSIWQDDAGIVHVEELAPVGAREMLELLTGNIYLSVLGLLAVAVAVVLDRRMLFLLFPLVLGLLAPLIGKRFVMFGALVIVLGGAIVLARLATYLSDNRHVQFGVLGALSAFYCFQLFGIYKANPPEAFGDDGMKQALMDFGRQPRPAGCHLIVTSWGEGYLAGYFARMPTVMNGASYPLEAVAAHAGMMLADDEPDVRRNACEMVNEQSSFVRKQVKHFDCGGELTGASRVFTVVTWADVLDVSRWLNHVDAPPASVDDFRVLDEVPEVDPRLAAVKIDGSVYPLATLDIVGSDEVTSTDFGGTGDWHLIVNEPKGSGLLLGAGLYETFFVKTFLGKSSGEDLEKDPERGADAFIREDRRDASLAIVSVRLGNLCPEN